MNTKWIWDMSRRLESIIYIIQSWYWAQSEVYILKLIKNNKYPTVKILILSINFISIPKHMKTQTKTWKKILYSLIACTIMIWWFVSTWVYAQSSDWETRLSASACSIPVTVEQAYDIDFWSFNSDDVFDGPKLVIWVIDGTNATAHTSNVPSLSTPVNYLVVQDRCGVSNGWHADILTSSMVDQNVLNTITWNDIPADNLKLITDGQVFFLESTPANSEVTATEYAAPTSFNTAVQLLERTSNNNNVWWLFGVFPWYGLNIPQHQQPDTYKGTITWTVI